MNNCFQDKWATKSPLVESMVGVDGRVHKVKCKVCNKIERHNNLLVLKLDYLWKHVNQRKILIVILCMATIGKYYFFKTNQHVFNACLYVSRGMDYVVQQVTRSIVVKKKWKKCLVCTHFHLLSQCRPITKYEEMQSLFVFLKMVNHPSIKMTTSWEIVESLYHVILITTQEKLWL